MWFAERMEPDVGLYNVPQAWRVPGTLSLTALRAAIAGVIERHEVLRTSFVERDGRLYQRIGEPWTPELDRIDLRGRQDAEVELASWLRKEATKPFDVSTNRLLRIGLAEMDGPRQVLSVCVHHIVFDAASTPMFLRELQNCYEAAVSDAAGEQEER